MILEVFAEIKNNKILFSTSKKMKLHRNAKDRTQVTVTKKYLSQKYVLESAKKSSNSNVESKNLFVELVGSSEINLPIDSKNVYVDITGLTNFHLRINCKIIKVKVIGSWILYTSQLKSLKFLLNGWIMSSKCLPD